MKMPVVFVGHGSPTNAIEKNRFSNGWAKIAQTIPKPKAILAVSAHWYTEGTRVMDEANPPMVYDMYGFPDELYRVTYRPDGAPLVAARVKKLIGSGVITDNTWGFDHGVWSVLCHMYPEADIPLCEMSVDGQADARAHFLLGRDLAALRDEGVLILASGNVVHNLAKVSWNTEGGYPWAVEFDAYIKDSILKRDFDAVIRYRDAGKCADMAFTHPDHFYPLLYALGASTEADKITVYNDACTMGALSMTSYVFGE